MDPLLIALLPLAALESRERTLTEQIRQHTRRITAATAAISPLDDQLRALDAERRALDHTAQTVEAELNQVTERRARAIDALENGRISGPAAQRQIDAFTTTIDELSDKALAAMERAEQLGVELLRVRADRQRAAEAEAAVHARENPPLAAARAELAGIDADREAAIPALPAADRRVFTEQRNRKTWATAHISGEACSDCHTAVPYQQRMLLKAGTPIVCATCRRWLYFMDQLQGAGGGG
jgi:predicted  nucleic acid-binding Zn-ribbon protein